MKARTIVTLAATLIMGLMVGCAATDHSRSTGQVLDDTSIGTQVKAKLAADSTTDAMDIDVEVDSGIVQLNGFVDSQAQKDKAYQLASSVSGTRSVRNNLVVSPGHRQAGRYIDDKALVVKVKEALAENPVADATEIDVEVKNGVVSLGGFVESDAERRAAGTAASGVNGVVRVVNNLGVR